jgi:hypothetical protein
MYRMSPEDIVALFRQRQAEMHPLRRAALDIRAVANGDFDTLALPMPELDGVEDRMSVANLLIEGLDGAAQRDASTFPEITSLALKRGQDQSERYAKIRRRAALGWIEMNKLPVRMGRRARHLARVRDVAGDAAPDRKRGIPRWQILDPLATYPGATVDPEDVEVPDGIVAYQRSLTWLLRNYPEKIADLHVGKKANGSDLFDVLEYVDDEQITLLVVGRQRDPAPSGAGRTTGWYSGVGKRVTAFESTAGTYGASEIVVLEQLPNRAGRCTMVMPTRVTLDQPVGQYDTMLGKFYWQARLSSLELIAIERGIFPSEWVVYPAGGEGKIITMADGRKGVVGEIEGGDYKITNVNPGYKTTEAIDRFERAMRHDGKIPAEMGGESPTNIRTDRRGISVFGNAVDFDRMEIQRIFETSLDAELSIATDVDRGYFGSKQKSFFVNWRGAQGPVDYTPSKHFEPGSTAAGPLLGRRRRRRKSRSCERAEGRRRHDEPPHRDGAGPEPARAVEELERIESEQVRRAAIAGYQAQVERGEVPAIDAFRVAELREEGMDIWDAIRQADQEARERQAAEAPPTAPEAQPGLAMPGMGAEAQPQAAAPAPPTLESLLSSVKLPGRPAPAGAAA